MHRVADRVRSTITEPTERPHIGNQINAALIFARSNFVNVQQSQCRKLAFQSQALSADVLDRSARFLQSSAHMKTTTLPSTNLVKRSPLRAFLLVPFVLACFALSPQAQAVCQQGCSTIYENTFLGEDALLTELGASNTAVFLVPVPACLAWQ